MTRFSVVSSVYINDKPDDFRRALESITNRQTVPPSEVVLVVDGPVPEGIEKVLEEFCLSNTGLFKIVRFENNQGLGVALQKGVEIASNEIIMRMDSDDIALPYRFEKQIKFMEEHPEVALCGGQIEEFIDYEDNIVGKRVVPCTNEAIREYMKSRCPFNHMTVAFRRSEILRVGNYQPWFWNEDYYLWLRMLLGGCVFANLPDTLVHMRAGRDMYTRRGGKKYYKSEKDLQKYMLVNGVISRPRYMFNVLVRWTVQVGMPNWLRGIVFQTLFRK